MTAVETETEPAQEPATVQQVLDAVQSGTDKTALELLRRLESPLDPLMGVQGVPLVALALDRGAVETAAALVAAAPAGTVSPMLQLPQHDDDEPLLLRALSHNAHALAEALVKQQREGGAEEVAADGQATPAATWIELAVDHGAGGVVAAFAGRPGFDPVARVADGRTLLEVALDKPLPAAAREAVAKAVAGDARYALACLSDGRVAFERLLAEGLALPLVAPHGPLLGTERLPDGGTVFERALDAGKTSASSAAVALAMVSAPEADGCVTPHGCASTGVSFFERALSAGAVEVVGKLAAQSSFDPLERAHDGRTMLELLLALSLTSQGIRTVALSVLASGKVPARALLSDGRTAFERVLRLNAKELILGAFAGQGLKPTMQLPPDERTCFELCLACPPQSSGAELAFLMVRFAGLDGLHVLGDGRTCFERVLLDHRPELAVGMVDAGSVRPSSRLPDGRTCIDFAASVGARDVCQALAKHV